jgi:HEPN domain-containing protein
MKQLRSGPPKTHSLSELRQDLRGEVERLDSYLRSKNIKAE